MKSSDQNSILPKEVRRLLESGDQEAAGERIREHTERIARTSPKQGRRWSQRIASADFEHTLFGAYVRWAVGAVHHLAGDSFLAEQHLEDAARAMRRAGRPDLADRVSLTLLDVYGEQLKLHRARALARRLERRFVARGDDERGAVVLANLACAEDAADRVDRARALWKKALQRYTPGGLRHLLARANLANSSALMGHFDEAIREHGAVADAAGALGFEALALQADMNLAEAEFAIGHVETALSRWQNVLATARRMGDEYTELVAEVDLAAAEADLGDFDSAERRLEAAVPRARDAGLRREEVRIVRQLAVLRTARGGRGERRLAQRQLRGSGLQLQRDLLTVDLLQMDPNCDAAEAARAARRLHAAGMRHRGAVGLAWAAKRYQERGDRSRAVRLAREALAKATGSAWVGMVAYQVLGRNGGAESTRHFFRAVHRADQLHGRLAATADRTAFLELRGDVYLDLVAALLKRNRPRDRRRALDVLSRFRSGWLVEELARRTDRGNDPEVLKWQELRRRLAALLNQAEGEDEPRVRRLGTTIHRELRQVEGQLRDSELILARRRPGLLPAAPGESVSRQLMDRLPDGHVYVEYFLDTRDLLTFVATRNRLTVHRTPVAAEIRRLVASVRFHMDTNTWRTGGSSAASAEVLHERIGKLGEKLLGYLPTDGWRALWVAPHAEIFHIPWAALELPGSGALVDRAVFSLVPGAGVAASLLQDAPRRPVRFGLCGAGGHDLPLVSRELDAISGLGTASSVVETATRLDFLDMLASHDVVHLAGHAAFLDGIPSASGLRLADGYVTVHDLAASRVQAQLVSFGVCSGARMADHADLQYEGFLRALLSGGVRTVVGAISPVRDEVAYDFDLEFFRRLTATGDPGEAYQGAVVQLRRSDPHPATWGNFHLYGDQRNWRTA